MSIDGQGTLWRRNIAENFNRLSSAHERYRQTTDRQTTDDRRQTTDRRTITYSEHELEFTFAKNENLLACQISMRYLNPQLRKTTSGFQKLTAAILEFYFRFRYRPMFSYRRVILSRVILHRPVKFRSNRTIGGGVMTSCFKIKRKIKPKKVVACFS